MQPFHAPAGRASAVLILSLSLAACGGGDGGGGAQAPSAPLAALSGTAATGAPMAGATIVVRDATGAQVQVCRDAADVVVPCTTRPDGSFTLSLRAGTQAPLVLTATPVGTGMAQVSMTGQAQDGNTVNITPITTLIAATLSPDGDPHALQPGDFDQAALQAAVAEIVAALQPLLDAVGTTADPLTGAFTADGTGMDKALDVMDVQVVTDAGGVTTVVAEIKLNGDDTQPASLTLVGGGPPVAANMAGVTPAALPDDGVAPLLADLLGRMSDCYNLPFNARVNTATVPHSIVASVCRDLFVDSDPGTYKSNGYVFGPAEGNAMRAFTSMFRNRDASGPAGGANTVTFDQPIYEFTRSGAHAGDVVFTYHWRDLYGNEDWDQAVVRKHAGQLRFIGNQYNHEASVRPFVQRREFVESSSGGFSYFSSGYNTWVRNQLDGAGNPLFDRVQITTPSGRLLTVWPSAGFDRLNYKRANGSVSGTPIINLQWAYWSGGSVGASGFDLADLETGRVFARDASGNAQQWTDDQIKAIPNQGKWRFDFFLAGNTGATPDETQWHTTLSRAQTLGEVQGLAWARLAPDFVSFTRSGIDPGRGGYPLAGGEFIDLQPTEPGDPVNYWSVPAFALAPTRVNVNGAYSDGVISQGFSDGQGVLSTATTTQIRCDMASAADQHCEVDGSGSSTGRFKAGSVINTLELWGKTGRGVERSSIYALYRRVP